jgi:hypothetical protein
MDLGEVTFVDWREHVPVFVTDPIQAVIVLRNIKALGHLRQQKMGKLRRYDEQGRDIGACKIYPISEATPMVLPVFDEWQFAIGMTDRLPDWLAAELGVKTVGDAILALTKDILTQYAKAMIGMLLAGQASGLMDRLPQLPDRCGPSARPGTWSGTGTPRSRAGRCSAATSASTPPRSRWTARAPTT